MWYSPSGDSYAPALVNSFVHLVMYSYYLCSTLKWNCPWKSHITKMQLTQFAFLLLFGINCWRIGSIAVQTTVVNTLVQASMLVLFGQFYMDSYHRTNRKQPEQQQQHPHGPDAKPTNPAAEAQASATAAVGVSHAASQGGDVTSADKVTNTSIPDVHSLARVGKQPEANADVSESFVGPTPRLTHRGQRSVADVKSSSDVEQAPISSVSVLFAAALKDENVKKQAAGPTLTSLEAVQKK